MIPTAVVNAHGAERVRAGHPWIYDTDILGWEPAPPEPNATAPVRVRERRGRALGWADFSPHSKIRLRLLSPEVGSTPEAAFFPQPEAAFFKARIDRALAYRARVVAGSGACRLVSAEADGLPGLIVDQYGPPPGGALVIQTLTWAMAARQPLLLEILQARLQPATVVERNDVRVRQREGLELRSGLVSGASAAVEVTINGLRFGLDLLTGQKTGGFLDQRENWARAAHYAQTFAVEDALDVFTYQGGFALHLARAGVGAVEAVDSSRPALEAAERNAALNQVGTIDWVEANAFDLLRDYERAGRRFAMVVLDPPAFAKSRSALPTAAAGYKEINLRALKLLRPGGVLVTCSCSHHLAEEPFLQLLAQAAADAHRPLTLLERRGQALDHPVLANVPETRYLKCVIARAS